MMDSWLRLLICPDLPSHWAELDRPPKNLYFAGGSSDNWNNRTPFDFREPAVCFGLVRPHFSALPLF
jgi:hypothetical protein